MAANDEGELPQELLKYRFKPSPTLQKTRKAVASLPNVAAMEQTRLNMMAQERELTKQETQSWRDTFLEAALGHKSGSLISQLLVKHKILYDKVIERQRKNRHLLERSQQEERSHLAAQFQQESWKIQQAAKKQAQARLEAEVERRRTLRIEGQGAEGAERAGAMEVAEALEGAASAPNGPADVGWGQSAGSGRTMPLPFRGVKSSTEAAKASQLP